MACSILARIGVIPSEAAGEVEESLDVGDEMEKN